MSGMIVLSWIIYKIQWITRAEMLYIMAVVVFIFPLMSILGGIYSFFLMFSQGLISDKVRYLLYFGVMPPQTIITANRRMMYQPRGRVFQSVAHRAWYVVKATDLLDELRPYRDKSLLEYYLYSFFEWYEDYRYEQFRVILTTAKIGVPPELTRYWSKPHWLLAAQNLPSKR